MIETPYSEEAEKSVLGAMLIDAKRIGQVVAHLTSISFYTEKHRHIFESLVQIYNQDQYVEFVTILDQLEKSDYQVDRDYIIELGNFVGSSANISSYIRIVKEKEDYRKLINICNDVMNRAYRQEDGPEALYESLKDVDYSPFETEYNYESETLDSFHENAKLIRQIRDNPLTVGIRFIDSFLISLLPQECLFIIAKSKSGKTWLVVRMIMHLVKRTAVVMFSAEMPRYKIESRAVELLIGGDVSFNDLCNAYLNDTEALAKNYMDATENRIHIRDNTNMTFLMMKSFVNTVKKKYGRVVVMIDSFSKIRTLQDYRSETEKDNIISAELDAFKKEINSPVIVIHHTNKEGDHRGSQKIADDLDFSISLEKISDTIVKPKWIYSRDFRGKQIETYFDLDQKMKEIDQLPTEKISV